MGIKVEEVMDFFRFPHTPHLSWLGTGHPRDDKLLAETEIHELLSGDVVVEEKVDGANLGISITSDGRPKLQNRGQYLSPPFQGQFSRLSSWLPIHEHSLSASLRPSMILFGEWCTAKHSLDYTNLPDWFIGFDIYDRAEDKFWSTRKRDDFLEEAGLSPIARVFEGKVTLPKLREILMTQESHYRDGGLEGLIIRKESGDWLEAKAKLVHPGFTQSIDEHWSRRQLDWNRLAPRTEAG